ncbi:MAG TPA: hypothetical protein VD838_11210 [Anaeromyxobacteraceae bacterium]|nr:hypothetical protein [Anaeromyxobacteraceae bacterium]
MVWKRVKAAVSRKATPVAPRADVLVTGPAPVLPPDATGAAQERVKKRAMLLSGLVEAASRRGRKL